MSDPVGALCLSEIQERRSMPRLASGRGRAGQETQDVLTRFGCLWSAPQKSIRSRTGARGGAHSHPIDRASADQSDRQGGSRRLSQGRRRNRPWFHLGSRARGRQCSTETSRNVAYPEIPVLTRRGHPDASSVVLKREHVGIPGDFTHYAAPRALVPYIREELYYHEGLSLQECVLPCLAIEFTAASRESSALRPSRSATDRARPTRLRQDGQSLISSWPALLFDEQEIEIAHRRGGREGQHRRRGRNRTHSERRHPRRTHSTRPGRLGRPSDGRRVRRHLHGARDRPELPRRYSLSSS